LGTARTQSVRTILLLLMLVFVEGSSAHAATPADPAPSPNDSPFPNPAPISQPDPALSGPTNQLPRPGANPRTRIVPRRGGRRKAPLGADPAGNGNSATPNADAISSEPVAPGRGERIQKIEIRGNQKIDREAVLEKVKSAVGTNVSDEQVRQDIVAIHKLGYFDSIQADIENGTLIFTVKERPAIYRIVFTGNDQLSTDDLKGSLSIKTYDIYDENLVRESMRKLTKFYEDKGFYLAKVDFTTRPAKEKDMVEVVFRVREYDKVRIKKITFLGNKAFSDSQLKGTLRNTSETGFFSWATGGGNFKELDFKNDLQMLQYWYLNEGYVRFRYEPPVVSVSEDKKWVYITIKVDEGKQYRMGNIDFGGDLLFPKEELTQAVQLKSGDVFSIIKRNQDIVALTEKYQDLGYANVNVVPAIDVKDDTLTVDTNYEFEKGTLVRFGRVTIKGNSKTRDKVIRRELRIHEGELFSGSGMRVSRENVERLGFFENESIVFQTKAPPGRPDIMDVEISVKERPTGQFQLGAGYATTTKFFFTTQISETNFMGKGQELRLAAQIAANKENRSFSLSFTDPYAWDTLWSAGGTLSYELVNIPDLFQEFRRGFQFNLGHPVGDYTRFYTGYRLESIRHRNVRDPYIVENLQRENGSISSLSLTLANDKRNNRLETTGGHYLRWNEEFAGLGGNRKFLRSIAEGRLYRKIWGDLTFRTKFEGGTIWNYGDSYVQRGERFLLGGSNNLRGYEYASVGRIVTVGNQEYNYGGLHQLIFMSELEYPIARELGLKFVVFYDAGDAFDKFNQISIKHNVGWGFRWFSPLGPLRFEWGYPLKKFGRQQGSQFNFMIGPPF
jgi:outer membrane protein insertion porin family